MVMLRKGRGALILALLPYLLVANMGFFFGWLCVDGPHVADAGHSFHLAVRVATELQHNLKHAAAGQEPVHVAGHCCACSASATLGRYLAEHATCRAEVSNPVLDSGDRTSLPNNPSHVAFRGTSFFEASGSGGNPEPSSLRTVILLI